MSLFLDYSQTADNYDNARKPVGLDILETLVDKSKDVLDVGCGTGSYLAAIGMAAKSRTGVDASSSMLSVARKKLPANVRLSEAKATDLPFKAGEFDLVMNTQVVHHLSSPGSDFDEIKTFVKECARVLRPGGKLYVNFCTPEQAANALWFNPLIPKASAEVAKRYPTSKFMLDAAAQAGFSSARLVVPLTDRLQEPPASLDPNDPLPKSLRDTDSTWGLAEDLGEIPAAIEAAKSAIANPETWHADMEERMLKYGETTILVATL